ncbi:MAG TPA: translation initiation factor IF-2 N-terminal domain-containing protein, partial [Nitrospiraceae bacterium]|nr:translation initiation factor IF-2 N-terminal domain-containing protein [Nitrospiraceae bacterium]
MENRDLIPELKRMGITVASHSSVLDDDVVQKVLEKLGPKLKAQGRTTEAEVGRSERSKAGLASDHAAGAKGGSAQVAVQAAEEASKSDKRRILIKRKRVDDVSAEEALPLSPVESAGMGGAHIDTLVVSPSPVHPHVEAPAVAHVDLSVTPDQPHVMGATAAPVPTASVKLPVVPSVDVLTGKKKVLSLEEMQAEGLKEKGKKVRKPGRTREEEELRLREDAARWQDLRAIPVQQRRDDRSKHVHHSAPGEVTKPRRKSFK